MSQLGMPDLPDDALIRRREHLMTELSRTSAPRFAPKKQRFAVATVTAALLASVTGGIVAAQAGTEEEPNVIQFDRYDATCAATWQCVTEVADRFGVPVLGPTDGTPTGKLVALWSATSEEVILHYRYRSPAGQLVEVDAGRGTNGGIPKLVLTPAEVASARSTSVAGKPAQVVATGPVAGLYASLAAIHYRFRVSANASAGWSAVAEDLHVYGRAR